MIIRLLVVLLVAAHCWSAVPTPSEVIGFEPGTDYKLADYSQITEYFQQLDKESPRLKLIEFGRSSEGRTMILAVISSEENLNRLDHYRDISRRLALGEATPEQAEALAREGKTIVWIDSGLHASEVAPAQHAPVLAHTMVTGETEEIRRIRENVILLQVPVMNPDGLDMIVDWYRGNVGTPYELAPLPKLYQKYAGHDNNRDWFMMNLQETRNVSRLLYKEWFPQIVYNQHQQPAFPARIFVPPYADPLNPNIPTPVMEGITFIGAAMKERFAKEGKPGVLSYLNFDAWWNGGARTAPAFHNMHGVLTETASSGYATPREDEKDDLPKQFRNGIPTLSPSIFYSRPWTGGRWGLRDAIEYMLTADFAILETAAVRRESYLRKAWELARSSIEQGKEGGPYAYVIPTEQWDYSSALAMLRRLALGGVTIHKARASFDSAGATYPAGTWVVLAAQPFRPYLLDLMEPQKYPELKTGPDGTTKRPYDIAGWTLPMCMGVQINRLDEPFNADLEPVTDMPEDTESTSHRENAVFLTLARHLRQGRKAYWAENRELVFDGKVSDHVVGTATHRLRRPRLGVYVPWGANIDTGWTRWVLDNYEVPYTVLRNADIRKGNLKSRFDSIILGSQSTSSLLNGFHEAEPMSPGHKVLEVKSLQRPAYTGGIGLAGADQIQRFVRQGGTLIALGSASSFPISLFPLPVKSIGDSGGKLQSPGSLVRVTVEGTHPIAFGMPPDAMAMLRRGRAFESKLVGDDESKSAVRSIVRYAEKDLLASGWLSGEKEILGKDAVVEVRHGQGTVVLFGFAPQFRGWTFGTFKLLLNSIYLASSKELDK